METLEDSFKKVRCAPIPFSEQETIISWDKEKREWHFYTNDPVHARKYEHLIIPKQNYNNKKLYHEKTNDLIGIEGIINGSVGLRKKRKYTDKEKEEMVNNLQGVKNR